MDGAQVVDEVCLEIDVYGLPGQADRAAREGDIVARLDTVKVLEEETAAGEAALLVVLRLQQQQRALDQQWMVCFAMPRPEFIYRLPAVEDG